ncbi:hypothetical protein EV207_1345 [Scopulibacillus darangshiensis]|uniref:Uncharacterized protein n=1 Tax=Scopulibacillus darangshiensis TaxID=442528 RepID=A0A4R2NLY5_9BACL|nr:hypothetical protein [Scopulibacillus darangshiensis]TCP22663.1 hypothetical protein EV207_1345 [Scopulibacillus darangshiensis]
MVTLAYFIILILTLAVIGLVDMTVSKSNFLDSLQTLFEGRTIVIAASIVGLIVSVINDIRLSKNKMN